MDHKPDLAQSSQITKLKYYIRKNGAIHALASGVGRKSFGFWKRIGPTLTSRAYERYRASMIRSNSDALLNLGSGSNRISGAFNVDMDPRADAFVDITRPLPLPDCAFRWIYCEEVIEHIDEKRGAALLRECNRVLVPGGTIRITTPDLHHFCQQTLESDMMGVGINEVFYNHGHRFIYSKPRIEKALKDAGFEEIFFSQYRDQSTELGPLDTHADRFNHSPLIAIYVEAKRP